MNTPVTGGFTEPIPTSLCLTELQYVDCLGKLADAPGAAAELAENPPGFELRVRALTGCAEFRMSAVGFFLRFRLVLPAVGDLRPGAALAALVGQGDQAGFLSTTGLR